MSRLFCDLHLHSCLSPCGDDAMTPATAAGMAKLAGLDVAALTDHNTTKNCPAFFRACAAYGVGALAGMELTTAEEIHLLCLFRSCEDATRFDAAVQEKRILIPNRTSIFGYQRVMDENDTVLAEEPYLLPNATTLTLSEAFALCVQHGGVCYPAHIDRESNGILAVLGTFPDEPPFRHAEFRDTSKVPEYLERYPVLRKLQLLFGSDAHRPEDIPDAAFCLEANGESPADAVFDLLKGDCR